jgi:hypothetical protein
MVRWRRDPRVGDLLASKKKAPALPGLFSIAKSPVPAEALPGSVHTSLLSIVD